MILFARLLLSAALLLLLSCERRPLEERIVETALVPIHIDWSQSMLDQEDINIVSVWFFPQDGTAPFCYYMQQSVTDDVIPLAKGKYSVIIFNETIEDNRSLLFAGRESYNTFYVTTADDSFSGLYSRVESEPIRLTPGALSSWSLDELEVTDDMVVRTRTRASARSASREAESDRELDKLRKVVPVSIVRPIQIVAYVQNLSSARKCSGTLKGATGAVRLHDHQAIDNTVTHCFIMNGRQYDTDNPNNGTIHSPEAMLVFGVFPPDFESVLQLDFELNDGTKPSSHQTPITDKMQTETEKISIEIGYGVPDDPEDPPIVLPFINATGDVGVDDWTGVNIPIN